jgi:2'-5' RNA ligase
MRLFIGIPLSAEVVHQLSTVGSRLRRAGDGLRWTAPESWHITLQFLGETPSDQYHGLVERLGEVRSPSFPVQIGALGFFDRAGVFFAGVELSTPLLSLQHCVTAATSLCGFVPETRPYHPHITLARAKSRDRDQGSGIGAQPGLSGLKAQIERWPPFTRFAAQDFNLYESFLGPGGSRYEVRERFPLA